MHAAGAVRRTTRAWQWVAQWLYKQDLMIDELEKQQGSRSISILLTRCRFVGGRAMSEGGRPSKSALLAGRICLRGKVLVQRIRILINSSTSGSERNNYSLFHNTFPLIFPIFRRLSARLSAISGWPCKYGAHFSIPVFPRTHEPPRSHRYVSHSPYCHIVL